MIKRRWCIKCNTEIKKVGRSTKLWCDNCLLKNHKDMLKEIKNQETEVPEEETTEEEPSEVE